MHILTKITIVSCIIAIGIVAAPLVYTPQPIQAEGLAQQLPPRPTPDVPALPTPTSPPDDIVATPPNIPTAVPTAVPTSANSAPTAQPSTATAKPTATNNKNDDEDDDDDDDDDDGGSSSGGGSSSSSSSGGGGGGGSSGGGDGDLALIANSNWVNANVGQTVEFAVILTNRGGSIAEDVQVVDYLPPFTQLLNATSSWGTVATEGNTVKITVDQLYPNDVVAIRVYALITSQAIPPNNTNTLTLITEEDRPNRMNTNATFMLWTFGW